MGLYLFNISVDTADPNSHNVTENLAFNDQESVVEIILEKVLCYDNIIKEYDDNDTEDYNKKSNVKIDLTTHYTTETVFQQNFLGLARQFFPDHNSFVAKGFLNLYSPPPQI